MGDGSSHIGWIDWRVFTAPKARNKIEPPHRDQSWNNCNKKSDLRNWTSAHQSVTFIKMTWAPPKLLPRLQKSKQVKHLLSKINLTQQYYADKLYTIIKTTMQRIWLQMPSPKPKAKAPYNYASINSIIWVSINCLSS